MQSKLQIVWGHISTVADAATDRHTIGRSEPIFGMLPTPSNPPGIRFEFRVFAIYLFSRAYIQTHSDRVHLNEYVSELVQRVDVEFGSLEVSGGTMIDAVAARLRAYGDWSSRCLASGRRGEEADGWIAILTRGVAASSTVGIQVAPTGDPPSMSDPLRLLVDLGFQGVFLSHGLLAFVYAFDGLGGFDRVSTQKFHAALVAGERRSVEMTERHRSGVSVSGDAVKSPTQGLITRLTSLFDRRRSPHS